MVTKHMVKIVSKVLVLGVVAAALAACSGNSRVRKPCLLYTSDAADD